MLKENGSFTTKLLGFSLRTLINMVIVFLLVEGFATSYHFSYMLFADVPYMAGQNQMVTITIEEGETATDIAQDLYDNRIVDNKYIFIARTYLGKYGSRMKAGKYKVNSTMSPDTLCRAFCGMQSEDAS